MVKEYIDISEKRYSVEYRGVVFYFTSETNAERFKDRLDDKVRALDERFMRQYHINANTDMLAAWTLYRNIELRDFLVNINGVDYANHRDILLKMEYVPITNV